MGWLGAIQFRVSYLHNLYLYCRSLVTASVTSSPGTVDAGKSDSLAAWRVYRRLSGLAAIFGVLIDCRTSEGDGGGPA